MGSIFSLLGDIKVLARALTTKPQPDEEIGSIALMVQHNADRRPDDMALISNDESVTWAELNEKANRVARVLKDHGIGSGDCVALFMENRIDFVVAVLGISKLGAVSGLINSNLSRQPLTHCISLVNSKVCIFGEELTGALDEVRHALSLTEGRDYLFVADHALETSAPKGAPPEWAQLLDSRDSAIDNGNLDEASQVTIAQTAFYVFTSGTTGMPKAAVVTNRRMFTGARLAADSLARLTRRDRIYNCLPLYHGTALIIGLAAAFHAGASTVMRRKVSISSFWDDIRKHECTSFIYIGEFIRYLMSQPPTKGDRDNQVHTIFGNGLRPDIWMNFKERFGIERIGEFYAASEGNGGFANVFNKDCTVGLGIAPVKLVQYDVASDEIVTDSDGHCIEVPDGTPGLLLIEVTEKSKFDGYTEQDATNAKIVENAFMPSDMYFNSGDLMRTVDVGFAWGRTHYQFVDRIGDTFRWKSENVSTNEVAEIINQHPDIAFSNVYGVTLPGTDGRAGMAAIVFNSGIDSTDVDIEGLSEHIRQNLPPYARPLFLRILTELPTTSTHKLQKNELREQAFHLDSVTDELLVLKPDEKIYARLDSDYYDRIMRREIAF
ncbi:MAG: long-chain-acyl-CoA synthetase [Proteobacteria bacterium]|nr:long-chain-acyl-CoA synthetase [Pseudomonadota bacterium]